MILTDQQPGEFQLQQYNTSSLLEKNNFTKVKEILDKNSVHYDELGLIIEKDMIIDNKTKVTVDELISSNSNWLKDYMSK